MLASIISNYKNVRPIYNCTHFAAWGIVARLKKLGWHNFRYRFLPPQVEGITLEANATSYRPPEGEEFFDLAMFGQGGFLHEEPLNHYIILKVPGRAKTLSINAGYLMHHFIVDESLGYAELARIIKYYAKKEDSTPGASVATGEDSGVPKEGDSQQE